MAIRMKQLLWPVGLPLVLVALVATALFALSVVPGQAVAGRQQASVQAGPEAWRLGVTSEGDASYAAVIGRLVDSNASFRSNRGVQDIYYIFPAPASARAVTSAALNVISRSGAFSSTATITLEVRNTSGVLLRTLSAAPIDLQTAVTGAWTTMALAASPANLTIAPGEHLVAHFTLAGGPGGDLDVRTTFEVVVQ